LETEKEGHAKYIIDKVDPNTDAIIVAGGDGTFSEVCVLIICTCLLLLLVFLY
jgi:diacylglycerol kinase family enzyme